MITSIDTYRQPQPAEALARLIGPASAGENHVLQAALIGTPLGQMLAIADAGTLVLLEFADRPGLGREVEALRRKAGASVEPGDTPALRQIQSELDQYFSSPRMRFETPIRLIGTPFQQSVWEALRGIPSGETRAYADIAGQIGRPEAVRAVGATNGANHLALIVPCHRVIGSNGELTGYAGGLGRKAWLLKHEQD